MEAGSLETQSLNPIQRRKVLLTGSALILLGGLNNGWIGPLLPTIAHTQALSPIQAGWLVSTCGIGSILAMSLGQPIICRLGAVTCLQFGSMLMAVGLAGIAMGNGFIQLLGTASILGFGLGITGVAASLCVLRFFGAAAAPALNRLHLFFGVGALTGPLIATAALSSQWSYRGAYVAGALLAAAVALSLRPSASARTETIQSDEKPPASVLRTPRLWAYAGVTFVYVGIEAGLATWLFTYLRDAGNLPSALASASMSVLWGGLTAGRLASAYLCGHRNPSGITIAAMCLSVVALAAVTGLPDHGPLTLLAVAALGLGFGPIYPNALAQSNADLPGSSSSVTPVVITCGALGGIVFPPLIGLMLVETGLQSAMIALFASAIVMLVLFTAVSRLRQAP